ncbi:MAG: helix-turn-helix transcriptional regulator [Provencibacterium sp.]|jgi:AraC family transcriptional regulator|nr:helix-turn-helix transcriptional regulator [Provencibacterium sp.]
MELTDKAAAVSRMQRFILRHIDEPVTLDMLAETAGYSKYHAARIFKELTHKTPLEYLRAARLTRAAELLCGTEEKVVDVALKSGFDSHDGFTRAFIRQFGITPQKYQAGKPPVNWFVYHPLEAYLILKEGPVSMSHEKVSPAVTVTAVERPARKLIFLRYHAEDYFSACEEVGCDWEGFYNSIPQKFDTAAGGRLPASLRKPGMGGNAFFVEVPLDYEAPLPDGYETAALPPCTYLYFNGMPFADPNDFSIAIGIVNEAIRAYPFEQFGWKRSDAAPYMGMGAEAETGARTAVPVEHIAQTSEE